MKDHFDMDEEGNFASQDAIEKAVKDGALTEYENRYIDLDGNEYYKDGTVKPSSFWWEL